MDKLIYFGDSKRIGFTRKTELGSGFISRFEVNGIVYDSVDQFMGLFKAILQQDDAELEYWQREMSPGTKLLLYIGGLVFLSELEEVYPDQVDVWPHIREGMMMKALRAKFEDKRLKNILLGTGTHELQFCDDDKVWGRRIDQESGDNLLGRCLMKLRAKLI